MIAPTRATIEDLYLVEGNAELVNGEIVLLMPVGDKPNRCGLYLAASMLNAEAQIGYGRAYSDGIGFRMFICRTVNRSALTLPITPGLLPA